MNPTSIAIAPPTESGAIMLVKAGIERTAYDVPNAPKMDNPLVV